MDREEMMMSVFEFGKKEKTKRGTLYASTCVCSGLVEVGIYDF